MPSKLKTPTAIPAEATPTFDAIEVTNVIVVNHIAKENEDKPSGNIEVGDYLAVDEAGNRTTEKKLAVHYVMTNADEVVHVGSIVLEEDALFAFLSNSPTLYSDIKAAAYAALTSEAVLPADATLT